MSHPKPAGAPRKDGSDPPSVPDAQTAALPGEAEQRREHGSLSGADEVRSRPQRGGPLDVQAQLITVDGDEGVALERAQLEVIKEILLWVNRRRT